MVRVRAAAAVLAGISVAALLSGCEGIRQATGAEKTPPNEFEVEQRRPLAIPQDFTLRPPQQGGAVRAAAAAPPMATNAMAATVSAAATSPGTAYSDAERLLLTRSNALSTGLTVPANVTADAGPSGQGSSSPGSLLFDTIDPVKAAAAAAMAKAEADAVAAAKAKAVADAAAAMMAATPPAATPAMPAATTPAATATAAAVTPPASPPPANPPAAPMAAPAMVASATPPPAAAPATPTPAPSTPAASPPAPATAMPMNSGPAVASVTPAKPAPAAPAETATTPKTAAAPPPGGVASAPAAAVGGLDPNGYYNPYDPNGYIDRSGQYTQIGSATPPPARSGNAAAAVPIPPAPVNAFYQEGRYEAACYGGARVAGTIFTAKGGGLFGDPVNRGDDGEIVGGVVFSGMLTSLGIDCRDQPFAFGMYANALNGDVGRRLVWRHGNGFGEFTAVREFQRGDSVCRDFRERTYVGGDGGVRNGTACRQSDGQWHFD